MDGAQGRLARWRLRLAEFSYTVESRHEHHECVQRVMDLRGLSQRFSATTSAVEVDLATGVTKTYNLEVVRE